MIPIPDSVDKLLTEYFKLLDVRLPDFLKAFYIYGSVAMGSFCGGLSDIDFAAVVNKPVTEEETRILIGIHKAIRKIHPHTDLMGIYVTEDDLKLKHDNTADCPLFIDGRLKGFRKFDTNSIDAYQLKKYGRAIKGPDIFEYDYKVNWDILLDNMLVNLNTYWRRWLSRCRSFPSVSFFGLYFTPRLLDWGVLGVTRLLYTFNERDIASKIGAGEYALRLLPDNWHNIINESLRLRKGIKKSYYTSIFKRRNDALAYMDYIIKECNRTFGNELTLTRPLISDEGAFKEFMADWEASGERVSPGILTSYKPDYDRFLRLLDHCSLGIGLAKNKVPSTLFILKTRSNRILGVVSLRHYVNKELALCGGHIGYAIRPSERSKGYATKALALALVKAKELGLSRVIISCDSDNLASAKVIEKNGGVLEWEGYYEPSEKEIRRYFIEVPHD